MNMPMQRTIRIAATGLVVAIASAGIGLSRVSAAGAISPRLLTEQGQGTRPLSRFRGMVASPPLVVGGERVRLTFYLNHPAPDGGVKLELRKADGLHLPQR